MVVSIKFSLISNILFKSSSDSVLLNDLVVVIDIDFVVPLVVVETVEVTGRVEEVDFMVDGNGVVGLDALVAYVSKDSDGFVNFRVSLKTSVEFKVERRH